MDVKPVATQKHEPAPASLGHMLDERVCLKIRINLLEHHETPSEAELSESRSQLAELERMIAARRKADGG